MSVCVGGGGERKEARARPCVRGRKNKHKNCAMDTKFNAPTVHFILFLFCLVFVCLFNSFYKYIVLK